MSKILFALAALAAATAVPAAATPRASGTRIVSYADLNLSAPAGRARLEQRIGAAVDAVCGYASPADLHGARAVRDCRATTFAQVARPFTQATVPAAGAR